jgi:hypothetical protein
MARCAVRAAISGADGTLAPTPLSVCSARWTRAGTAQRAIPTTKFPFLFSAKFRIFAVHRSDRGR